MNLKPNNYSSAFFAILMLVGITAQAVSKNENKVNKERVKKRPNIVYVLTDEWRAQATGYAGGPNVKTPNLDLLANKSINFSNAVSVLPVCTPHRAALLTGRYPTSTGMFLNDLYLPARELTMAEIFKQAGYNTGYIGKWHLDGHGRLSYIPKERRQGFDYWKANECSHNYNHSKYFAGEDTTSRYWEGYDAFAQTADAQQYIKKNAQGDRPFILVVAYGGPHYPHKQAPEKYKKMYNADQIRLSPNVPADIADKARKESVGYYAHCTALDSCVGALRRTIEEAGIDDNTIFIFTADHGEMLGSHGVPPEKKQRPWDESIRVPFLLHYPVKAGKVGKEIKEPINTPDILPTLLGLSELKKPESIQGEDISGLITGEKKADDRVALVMNMSPFSENYNGDEFRGIKTSSYTYVKNLEGPWMLYDNEKDPYQMNNLIDQPAYAKLKQQLDKRLQEKLNSIGDKFLPAEEYIKKWGYNVNAKGAIDYGNGPHAAQSPSSNK